VPMRLSARPARLRQRSSDQTPICVTSTTLRHGSLPASPFWIGSSFVCEPPRYDDQSPSLVRDCRLRRVAAPCC
jgi:hypothetical protein